MVRNTATHRCTECGWTTPRWVGRCSRCEAWGSIAEEARTTSVVPVLPPSTQAQPIGRFPLADAAAVSTGVGELDRVLGAGLVPGAVVLLAGEPGVGKSTLLLEVASRWARAGRRTLYVSAEESAAQVRLRATRTNTVAEELFLAAETDLGAILGHVEQTTPSLLILDSVQAVGVAGADGVAGGVSQVRDVTNALVRLAKRRGFPVLLVGHVTKDGSVAGPRLLEHLVDVVLTFEGDQHSGFRMVRATKNRFGPADEVGCFEMTPGGISEVPDPSRLFTSTRSQPLPGTSLTVTLDGRRPLLGEVQALVAPSASVTPRRVAHGLEASRISVILAVLERKAGIRLHNREVYVSTVGGARMTDPSVDLAVAVAVASAASEQAYHRQVIALGEIGLSGELRRVPDLERRLAEARRLGFDLAVVPRDSRAQMPGIKALEAPTVAEALEVLQLRRRARGSANVGEPGGETLHRVV